MPLKLRDTAQKFHARSMRYSLLISTVATLLSGCENPKQFSLMPVGISFTNEITETPHNNILTYEYTYNGGGVAVGDLNNDGLADIYFSGNTVPNKLLINRGDWEFEDISEVSQTQGKPGWKTGVTMADVNGDGWLDIYVCYSGNSEREGANKPVVANLPQRSNQLFINRGCPNGGVPVFDEKAVAYGLDAPGTFSTQAYFFDYDHDGDLDMFLLNHANMFYSAYFNTQKLRNLRHPYFGNKLYENAGGRFTETSENAGIHGSGLNFGLSAAISDLNGDNWPDIYVTNDYDEQDFCYINNRNGTFSERSHTLFGHLSKNGMGSDIADINNDGLPDIFVGDMLPEDNYRQKLLRGPDAYDKYQLAVDSGYHHQYMRNTLQLNRGFAEDTLPRFSEIGQLAGISNTDWSWAGLMADFDNDGLKDLFITNGYLRDYTSLDFLKYTVNETIKKAGPANSSQEILALIQKMTSTKISNYCFANTGGIGFENVTSQWGLDHKTVSNAAAYADLDNDGDLDLVVNNLNEESFIYQNHENELQRNNYLKIRLAGEGKNTFGTGSKIEVKLDGRSLYYEAYTTRGYQSSVEPVFTIGVGKAAQIKEIRVTWPDDRVSTVANVSVNKTIVVDQQGTQSPAPPQQKVNPLIMKDVTTASGLDFRHTENRYVDFKNHRLLPYQLSRLGGKLATGDVNGDGNDDVYFCGAADQPSRLYIGNDDGTLTPAPNQPWEQAKASEEMDALFFDADKDGDPDLYVVSGGSEFPAGDPRLLDRLYINDGNGGFALAENALPAKIASGSCVAAGDFDLDGDLDLFTGARLIPGNYPLAPESVLLRNDSRDGKVQFSNVSEEKDLRINGLVTDAVWANVDDDDALELVVAGEWMPVRIFKYGNNKFTEITEKAGISQYSGWWTKISVGDFDGDGDTDLLAGNAGRNMQLKAGPDEPMRFYPIDINRDGQLDPVLSYFIQGKSYPLPSRDELLEQVVPLRKKFIRYAQYANATIEDFVDDKEVLSGYLSANTLESSLMENDGNGKFTVKPLPVLAQISAINGFVEEDFDGDGSSEILAAGNFFPYRVELGRNDASTGVLLKIANGQIETSEIKSPVWLSGDIRDMALMKFNNAPKHVVVSRNNDFAGLYRVR